MPRTISLMQFKNVQHICLLVHFVAVSRLKRELIRHSCHRGSESTDAAVEALPVPPRVTGLGSLLLLPSFHSYLSLARSQLVKVQMSVRPHPTWFPLTDHSVRSSIRPRARLPPSFACAHPLALLLACPFIAQGFMLNAPIAKSTTTTTTHPSSFSLPPSLPP